jgi:hypothetical protein
MRRSLIFCRLAMLALQQAAKQGDDGLLRAFQRPDGVGKDAFIARVLEATDNPRITTALAAWSSARGVRGHEGVAGVLRAARRGARA